MKKVPTIIYAVALLRTIASAISGFAIEIFVRLSGASDVAMSLIVAVPSVTYMLAALFLSGQVDKLGRRVAIVISSGVSFLATIFYIGIFVAVANLSVMIIMVIIVEAIEGTFAGWFWPVLQARLGEGTNENGREIRIYNLSWNLGVVLGNVLVTSYASVSADPAVLFPIIIQVLVWSTVINSIIIGLLLGKHGTNRNVPSHPVIVVASPNVVRSSIPVSVGIVLVALFTFSFNIGGILGNVFNQVTAISANATFAMNLLPWIPIIDTTRQMAQLAASGTYKGKKPALSVITRIITLMSVLALVSGIASNFLAKGGLSVIVIVLGIHGILSGILYNATMKIIIHDAPVHQRGRFQGLYEAVLGLGFFVGPIVAGAISEVKGYLPSYNIVAGISFIVAAMIASVQGRDPQGIYARVTALSLPQTRPFPVAIKVAAALAILWIGFRVLGRIGSLLDLAGIALMIAGTVIATVVLLKPRSDHVHAFDKLRSPRPHVLATRTPNTEFEYWALSPVPLEVIPPVPC